MEPTTVRILSPNFSSYSPLLENNNKIFLVTRIPNFFFRKKKTFVKYFYCWSIFVRVVGKNHPFLQYCRKNRTTSGCFCALDVFPFQNSFAHKLFKLSLAKKLLKDCTSSSLSMYRSHPSCWFQTAALRT